MLRIIQMFMQNGVILIGTFCYICIRMFQYNGLVILEYFRTFVPICTRPSHWNILEYSNKMVWYSLEHMFQCVLILYKDWNILVQMFLYVTEI